MNTIGLIPGTARDGSHKAAAKAKKKLRGTNLSDPLIKPLEFGEAN